MSLHLIVPMKSPGKTVQLADGSTSNGTKIQLGERLPVGHPDFNNQTWLWNGTIFRSGKDPRKCLQLEGGKTSNGTKILLYDMVGNNVNNAWGLDKRMNIVSRKDPSVCWNLDGGKVSQGTQILVWNTKNHQNSVWNVEKLDVKVPGPMGMTGMGNPSMLGMTPMVNPAMPMGMTTMGMNPMGNLNLRDARIIVPQKNQRKTVQLAGGRTSNGTRIIVGDRLPYGHKDYMNQVFLWDGNRFRSAKDPSKSITLDHGRSNNGSKLQLWDIIHKQSGNDENFQKFVLVQNRFIRTARFAMRCWHLTGGNDFNGTEIEMWSHNPNRRHAKSQEFEFRIENVGMGARM